jgi:hypothetical protein
MAEESDLTVLRSGVNQWNSWREKYPQDRRPDLREAKLEGLDLRGANLLASSLLAPLRSIGPRRLGGSAALTLAGSQATNAV